MATPGMQAAFDRAVCGIMRQGCKSQAQIDGTLMCAYRGDKGMKCAVGHLLSDEQIERYGVAEATNPGTFPEELLKELIPDMEVNDTKNFLRELQHLHDSGSDHNFLKDFSAKVKPFAISRGLKVPSINGNQ